MVIGECRFPGNLADREEVKAKLGWKRNVKQKRQRRTLNEHRATKPQLSTVNCQPSLLHLNILRKLYAELAEVACELLSGFLIYGVESNFCITKHEAV